MMIHAWSRILFSLIVMVTMIQGFQRLCLPRCPALIAASFTGSTLQGIFGHMGTLSVLALVFWFSTMPQRLLVLHLPHLWIPVVLPVLPLPSLLFMHRPLFSRHIPGCVCCQHPCLWGFHGSGQ